MTKSDFILTNDYLDARKKDISKYLDWLTNSNFNEENVKSSLKFPDHSIAIHHLANQNKKVNYRQLFFNSGLMWHYFNVKYNSPEKGYWFPPLQVCYLIFSDNKQLIELVDKSDSFPFNGEYTGNYFSQMLLAIATNNWDKLSDVFSIYMNTFENKESLYKEKDIHNDIFSAFIDRDTDKLTLNINLLESTNFRKSRIKENVVEKYFSKTTTTFAKLAKMSGMEIDIDSENVPSNLLSFSPLEEYTIPYRFLRDWYREQGIIWRYDPIHPELQDWENDPENPDRNKGGFFRNFFGK